MCTTCFSTASEAVSWGTPAVAAGAAAVMTGIRMRFPSRRAAELADAGAHAASSADQLSVDEPRPRA